MSAFSFSFSGDDIEDTSISDTGPEPRQTANHAAETGTLRRPSSSAFPIAGQPMLEPQGHDLETMLSALPSKIAYSSLVVKLDDGTEIYIPRRELWDVRVQLMAEEDDEGLGNLGKDDVRTGVYEGGFKSWESSVDLVKVLYEKREDDRAESRKFLELGCGTALPSLAVFQWQLQNSSNSTTKNSGPLELGLADYNPTVLQLVTLPNLLLSWAQVTRDRTWEAEGELEIDSEVLLEFVTSLKSCQTRLSFFSGAWSAKFGDIVLRRMTEVRSARLTIIGAETIYSPAALESFAATLMELLGAMTDDVKTALVAAKKVYFGVGGSVEDFCDLVRAEQGIVEQIREESDGVRRSVVEVKVSNL